MPRRPFSSHWSLVQTELLLAGSGALRQRDGQWEVIRDLRVRIMGGLFTWSSCEGQSAQRVPGVLLSPVWSTKPAAGA